jgi:hypothetical protein
MNPAIVCLAKMEHDYIEEFVRYHIAIGFKRIYIYDNEDVPTYHLMLKHFSPLVKIIHIKGNNYSKAIQFMVLDHFVQNYLYKDGITHVAHIDIDEFIVLKKHKNITDFINEYIVGNCAGIGMNWRFFGSSNQTQKTNIPNTIRFTMCEQKGNEHIKTIFNKDFFIGFRDPHCISVKAPYCIKSTNGAIINGSFNFNIDLSVIQLNHYKSKTWPEFQYIRNRGRADFKTINESKTENVLGSFIQHNKNEVEDFTAHDFYQNLLEAEQPPEKEKKEELE